MRLKADLLLFMVAVIWGTAFVAQGIAGQYHIAFLFNGVSFMLAGVFLIPFIPKGHQITKGQCQWMLVAGFILCIATAILHAGIFLTTIANAVFLPCLYVVS